MTLVEGDQFRWGHYLFHRGSEFSTFWEAHLSERQRDLLFVLGLGFDPRMCAGVQTILQAGGKGVRNCLLIKYDEGPDSPSKRHSPVVEKNRKLLYSLFSSPNDISLHPLEMWSNDGRRIGSRRASEIIQDVSQLSQYSDIIVDVSALPRSIFFPLLAKLLFLLDKQYDKGSKTSTNLHSVTAEDVLLDERIKEEGIDDNATYLHGFSKDLELVASPDLPKVWIPVLGEGKETQLTRIYEHVKPDEICPVIPSPSANPRKGDDLLIEYRTFLFDELRVEPQNIIYACEANPFEAYRQILQTIVHYNDVLEALQGCKVVISAVSSKLLSIGALLAAYEAKAANYRVGISNIEAYGYSIDIGQATIRKEMLNNLWLAGECYDN